METICKTICKCEKNSGGNFEPENFIDKACNILCKCKYDSLDEGFINYEKEIKGKEFKILLFIIVILMMVKMIF